VQSHLISPNSKKEKLKKEKTKGTARAGIPKINSGTDTGGDPPVSPP